MRPTHFILWWITTNNEFIAMGETLSDVPTKIWEFLMPSCPVPVTHRRDVLLVDDSRVNESNLFGMICNICSLNPFVITTARQQAVWQTPQKFLLNAKNKKTWIFTCHKVSHLTDSAFIHRLMDSKKIKPLIDGKPSQQRHLIYRCNRTTSVRVYN